MKTKTRNNSIFVEPKTNIITKNQLKLIINYAKNNCKKNDFEHKFDHIQLTAKLSGYLAVKEKANYDVCIIAAYLHDIATSISRKTHAAEGAILAMAFMRKIKISPVIAEKVCYAISQHSNDLSKKTKEAEILWDSDKLQLVGPLGFARIMRYCLIVAGMTDIESTIHKSREYEIFFYKRFYTKTAKTIAKKLHNFMAKYHKLIKNVNAGSFL